MTNNFFAAIFRMKYIHRWALMRNSRPETLAEHAMEVAMIAHVLCLIGNKRYKKNLDSNKAAVIGLFHDASEIITGDMPTPVKYYSEEIKTAYKNTEKIAVGTLLSKLPEDLCEEYEDIFKGTKSADDIYMRKLVKAADKLSALIKCIEEEKSGNTEFTRAKEGTERILLDMQEELPEVKDFMDEFLPPYGRTLDDLLENE